MPNANANDNKTQVNNYHLYLVWEIKYVFNFYILHSNIFKALYFWKVGLFLFEWMYEKRPQGKTFCFIINFCTIYFINLPDDPVNFVLPTIFGYLLGTDFIGKLKLSFFHPHCSAATMLLLLLPYCNSNIYYHYSGLV